MNPNDPISPKTALPSEPQVRSSAWFGVMLVIAAIFLGWQLWPLWKNVIQPLIQIHQTMNHIEETVEKMKTTNSK